MNFENSAKNDSFFRTPLEGDLLKFTNAFKGYQFRRFRLDPHEGTFEYLNVSGCIKDYNWNSVHLAGALITPCDKDSRKFTVYAASNDVYKIKAKDARERLFWVQILRAVVEDQNRIVAAENPPLPSWVKDTDARRAFLSAKMEVEKCSALQREVSYTIDKLPLIGTNNEYVNLDLLLLKSTTDSIVNSIQQCLYFLKTPHSENITSPSSSTLANACSCSSFESSEGRSSKLDLKLIEENPINGSLNNTKDTGGEILEIVTNTVSRDVESDTPKSKFSFLKDFKQNKNLTKTYFPSEVLEPVSLLEYFSNVLSHPLYLIAILDEADPLKRMMASIRWYLAMLNLNWKDIILSKPLNPVIGETFHCSWKIPKEQGSHVQVTYLAEQVSHRPPISAFYMECLEKKLSLESCIRLTPKFMGRSIVINSSDKLYLKLLNFNEEYSFDLPTITVESFSSDLKAELSGRVSILCKQTGFCSNLKFNTQSTKQELSHKITGNVKKHKRKVVAKISGQWLNQIEFKYKNGETQETFFNDLIRSPKYVRPIEKQEENESRKFWVQVIDALKSKSYDRANFYRNQIRITQNQISDQRKKENKPYLGKLFRKNGKLWVYKYPLTTN